MRSQFKEIWKCSVCNKWFPTEQIRKVPHDSLMQAGSNYVPWSDPPGDGTWWQLVSIDPYSDYVDRSSMGTSGDFRLKVQESESGTPPLMGTSLLYPAATYRGSLIAQVKWPWDPNVGAPDMEFMTNWDSFCFGLDVGPKEDAPTPLVVRLGIIDVNAGGGLANATWLATWNIIEATQCWCSIPMTSFPIGNGFPLHDDTLAFYVQTTTPDDLWWTGRAFLMKNKTSPHGEPVYETTGTQVDILKDTWVRQAVYACPKDADEVLLRRRTPGRRENRMIPPYEERET